MAKDYYSILGVEKSATKDDIKSAFRKLAHQYHPDKKGGDEAKFKEVSEAYSILGDDRKRAEYDAYGRVFTGAGAQGAGAGFEGFDFSGFQQGAGFNVDFTDIFGDFADMFGAGFGGGRGSRGRDISIDIQLSFKESVFGIEKNVLLMKNSVCDRCSGKGAEPDTKLKTCPTCNGKGRIQENRQTAFGTISMARTCETCRGNGKVPETACTKCHGEGVVRQDEEIVIKVPPGIEDGQMIRLAGEGEAVQAGSSGDLYVKVHVAPDSRFRKEGLNLITTLNVKLTDALLGASYKLDTLDGVIDVKVPKLGSFDEILRVKGKGIPHAAGHARRGDLLIRLKAELPQKLSKEAMELLKKLREEGI